MFQFKPNTIRQEEESKPEEKKPITTWEELKATLNIPRNQGTATYTGGAPDIHGAVLQASGIALLERDVLNLLNDGKSYFSSYKAGDKNDDFMGRVSAMRTSIAEEKQYFERNKQFFSAEELTAYNSAMDEWDSYLQQYESAMKTGGAAYDWLNQDNMVFNQAFTPQGTNFRASSREAAEYGMGLSSLEQQVQTLAQQAEEWTKVGYRPTAEQAAQMRQDVNQAIAGVKYARYYAGQNSIHFTRKEMDAMEAYFNSAESFLQSVQEYTADSDLTNPLTGKKVPSLPKTATDVNADGTADIMYPGGELGVMQMSRSAEREAPLIEKQFEKVARYEKYNQNFLDGNFDLGSAYKKAASAQSKLAPIEEQLEKLNSEFVGRDDLREEWRRKLIAEAEPLRQTIEEYVFYYTMVQDGAKNDKETVAKGKQLHKEAMNGYSTALGNRRDYKTALAMSNEGSNDTLNSIRRDVRREFPLAIDVSSLSEEDQTMFYYLVGIGKEVAAISYANDAAVRNRQEFSKNIREWAGKNFGTGVLATLGSVALLPFSWGDPILAENANALTGLSTTAGGFGALKDNLRAGVAESINESVGTLPENLPIIGGAGLGELYQLGMSGVDSYVSGLLFGSTGASFLLGTSAMTSTYNNSIERGAEPSEALVNGLAAGVAETLFEKISLEKLFNGKVNGSMLKKLLVQGGIEASEETLTSIANHFTDVAIMGDKSEYNIAVQRYLNEGKTQEEAESMATKDFFEGVAQDALGGFLIGSTMQSIQEASTKHEANTYANKFAELIIFDNFIIPEYEEYAELAGVTAEDNKEIAKEKFKKWALSKYQGAKSEADLPTLTVQLKQELDAERPSAQGLIEQADGSFGEVSAQHFTPATVQEDLDDVIAAYDRMESSATELDSAIAINANIAKMAQTVMKNAEAALDEGYIGQLQYDNYRSVLIDIYEESSGNLDAYLDEVYGARTDAAVVETEAETPAAESMQPETAVQTEITQKNMTAEPSENLGGTENAEVFDDGSQRDESLGTGRQVGAVAEGTGGSIAGKKTSSQAAILSNLKSNGTAQSARSIGVENGSEDASLYVLSDEDIESSQQWKSIKADAEADGASVVLFAGDLKVYNPTTKKYARVEGIHQVDQYGNTTYYVKADKRSRTAQQIYMHEKFHEIVSANPGLLGDLVDALEAQFGSQEVAALVNSYVEAYDGIYGLLDESMTADEQEAVIMQYMNEVFADVYAGIRRGRVSTAKAKQIMDSQTTEIQRAAQNRKTMQNKNAPPEQRYSLEGYSEHQIENWKNSKRIIVFQNEAQLREFVRDAINGINVNKKIYFGKVSHELGQRIYADTGLNVEGFNCSLSGYEVQKILKNHGNEQKEALRGQRAITEDDFVSIPEIVQSPDRIILSPKLYNGKPVIEFEKNKNGKINVTAYVSDKHIDLIVQTMYANKKSGNLSTPTDEQASANTPEANNGTVSTINSLTNENGIVKQEFSFADDVAELDAGYARHMAEDDTPEGLAPDDDQIEDYHAIAKAEKERRAKHVTANKLKNRIKSSEQAIAAHREAKNALKNIGGLTKEAAAQLDKKIELIRETMQIDRAALKEKQDAEAAEKKRERKEKQEIEIREQKAKTAQKELRQDLLNLFSVKPGVRFELAQTIDAFSDELIRSGKLTNEQRRLLFDTLYEYGEEFIEADEYHGDIRKELHEGRIYVSDSVRAEFGDDWEDFRKRAWGNRIYLTNNQSDMGIDSWTESLRGAYGGSFDGNNDLKTQLEIIIELAEEGKGENVTIAEMMRRNQDDYGWSIEEQMDELEQKVDRMLETFAQKADLEIRLRQESVRKLMNERSSYIKKMEDQRTARMENTARNQVMRGIEKLSKMRRKASPEYRKQIDEVLKDIDTVARSISARGLEDLQELSRLYLEQKEAQGENFLSSPYVEARLGRLQKTQLDDMSIDDVRELGRMVSSIANAIQNSNKLLADQKKQLVETVAENVHQEVQKAKGSKGGALRNYLLNHMDAKRVFGQLSGWSGGAFEALGENLSKGQERMMHYQLNAMRIFDDFLAKKENRKWVKKAAGKDAEWIKIEVPYRVEVSEGVFEMTTKQIQITPMMRISLLLHSKNEDNLRHIKGGGIRVPNKELYKKGKMKEALVRGEIVKMDPATVRAIVKECTEEEKNFAKLLEQYFNGLSKNAINEVSMLLDGFERAGGEHYYHIKTDPAFLKKQNAEIKRDLSVQALGSVVNERLHASNPIVLEDATAALMEHIENISKYYGFAVPLRDLNAVLSHTFHQKDNAFSDSVMNTIQQKWGSGAEEYIDKLMADLQMPERSSDLISSFAAKLRGNYAQAVIAANLSSLLKQITSYLAALPYLKTGGLLHGLKKLGKNDLKTLEKYSAVYWYRNQGNATMELSDALKRKDFGDSLPWLFNATQKMDSFTTRRLLAACEYRVQHDMNLRPGTQEEIDSGVDRYWTEVAKLFNEVVLKTQSNSTTMEKPQITRANAKNLSRAFTMFRTDPFQQYNMMVEAFGRMNAAKRAYKADASAQNKKALKEARKFTARTMTGILTSQMGCVLVAMLLKTARFDDDEFRDENGDPDWGKIGLYFGSGVIEGFSGFLVGAEILYSAAEVAINKFVDGDARWWDIEPTGLSTINDGISALLDLIGAVEEGKLTDGKKAFRAAAIALSKGIGFPAENLEKYLLMTTRWFAPEWAEQYQNFWEEIDKNNLSKESMRTIGDAIGVLMDNRTDGLSDEHKDEIARLYVAGGVGAVPPAIPSSVSYTKADGEEVKIELNGKQQEKYREVWRTTISNSIAELISSDAYEQANDEGKAELLDKLYKYANQIAQNAVVPEKEIAKWVQQGQNAVDDGIPLEEYISFRVALSKIDGKDDSGETVSGLKAQRCMEYLETMGWSDEQEKNIYLDVLASEDKTEDTKALLAAGLTWNQTNDIVSMLSNKKWDHMNAIICSNASEKVKVNALMVYASDKEKILIRTGYLYGIKLAWYAEVLNHADADDNGHISQEEAEEYINSMNLSRQEKAYLWQMITDGKEGKSNPFGVFGKEFWYEAHKDDPIDDA